MLQLMVIFHQKELVAFFRETIPFQAELTVSMNEADLF